VSGRNRKKAKRKTGAPWYQSAWISGLMLLAVAVYLGLSLVGGTGPWWQAITGDPAANLIDGNNPGGPVGSVMSVGLHVVFGALWCWTVPLAMAVTGLGFLLGRPGLLVPVLKRAVPLWLVTVTWLGLPGIWLAEPEAARLAGLPGFWIARGFSGLIGSAGAIIFLSLCLLITLVIIFRPWLGWLPGLLGAVGRGLGRLGPVLKTLVVLPFRGLKWLGLELVGAVEDLREMIRRRPTTEAAPAAPQPEMARPRQSEPAPTAAEEEAAREARRHHDMPEPEPVDLGGCDTVADPLGGEELVLPGASGEFMGEGEAPQPSGETEGAPVAKPKKKKRVTGPVSLPSVGLLTPAGPETESVSTTELDAAADLLESTLRSFSVEGEVKDVRPGPVVTTFEFQPGHGIRVNQIVQRTNDLALAMRARSIRMEAPIPGKAAVGIEIPNPVARMVRLREVLELLGGEKRNPLQVVLGKDVVGRPVSIDIASLPHLLVAGSTGSGKSVCLNAIISNLLLRNTPSTLRMVLIDPKMLEMNVYNGIPHLLLPVVTDPKESLKALQWMVAQMEFRYRKLAKCGVRNIQQYNDKVLRGDVKDESGETVTEIMPYYLTIVDELADLMLQLGKDLEDLITRLAQKARAVGIHLILATQRPSVDVLTGVIKANIPCRIAFRVIQMNDSRTILDMKGAEQLLGHGDMLYLQPGRALPVRVHGSFIDVDECEAVAAHWRQYKETTEEINLYEKPEGGVDFTGEDDLFEQAVRVVVQHQSGSASLLQRRLRVGYTRAGRLIDMMEEAGVVGPFTGSKAREVLWGPDDLPSELEGEF